VARNDRGVHHLGSQLEARVDRLYSLEEANATLERVRPWLVSLKAIVQRIDDMQARLGSIEQKTRLNGRAAEADALTHDIMDLGTQAQKIVQDLIDLGIELKDPRQGLIDFRSRRYGRVVYLCWRIGEDQIAYWHDLDAGFAGRQPLE
jgi:hypothetical protein